MQGLLSFLVDVLKVPAILVGLIALVGLVAQKKAFPDVIKGTIYCSWWWSNVVINFIGAIRKYISTGIPCSRYNT